jgi:osmotically-inducible protein OsmY
MKTDAQIQTDVLQELKWEPSVVHEHIGVTVSDGVVTLSGKVPTYIEKSAAEKATQRVANRINIQVRGSEVVLSGEVRSFAELRDARGAAYSAPGVTYVENNLHVGSLL